MSKNTRRDILRTTAGAGASRRVSRCPRSIGSSTTRICRLVNYIRNAGGNHASPTSADAVTKVRTNIEDGGG